MNRKVALNIVAERITLYNHPLVGRIPDFRFVDGKTVIWDYIMICILQMTIKYGEQYGELF